MNETDTAILTLLAFVALQTTYLTVRAWRGSAQAKNTAVLIDTSVLMDGRILPITQTGFMPGSLVIPRSVVAELQLLADKSDSDKREKARRGLDVIHELQALESAHVTIFDDSALSGGVDDRLLLLAKKYGNKLCTIDYNLNKVAVVEGIEVLNVNDLAKQLRMAYLPGDVFRLELTQPGSDSHQAIGHLDDGTMVVVEQARKQIGTTVNVEVIRSLQTAAGRMMFAKRVQPAVPAQSKSAGLDQSKKQQVNKIQQTPAKKQHPRRASAKGRSVKRPTADSKESDLIQLVNEQS